MALSTNVTAQIEAVEAKLAQLDPILHRFCAGSGYAFSSQVGVWPRRRVWAREEIDRMMSLTTDLTVPQLMTKGFYPEMPWSLYADASTSVVSDGPNRILTIEIFRALPFRRLSDVLEAYLQSGRSTLAKITLSDIKDRGKPLESHSQ